jgi:hypothetical protein
VANIIVHFEIYADDMERAQKFYETVLGWAFSHVEAMNYTLVFPGGEVTQGPAQIGINGGIVLRPAGDPALDNSKAAPNAFVCTISVSDIDDILARVEANGGRIDIPVNDVPGVGRMAYIRDTEANMVGLLQPAS